MEEIANFQGCKQVGWCVMLIVVGVPCGIVPAILAVIALAKSQHSVTLYTTGRKEEAAAKARAARILLVVGYSIATLFLMGFITFLVLAIRKLSNI